MISFFGSSIHFQVLNDEPCTLDRVHEVELLLPFMKDTYAEGVLAIPFPPPFFFLPILAMPFFVMFPLFYIMSNYLFMCCSKACSQKDVLGVLAFNGSVCSFAYLNPKEPISQAVSDIKVFNNQFRRLFQFTMKICSCFSIEGSCKFDICLKCLELLLVD